MLILLISKKKYCSTTRDHISSEGFLNFQEHKEKLVHRYQQTLLNSLTPPYKHLFDDISKLQYGIPFLVSMRKDLLVSLTYTVLGAESLRFYLVCY